MKRINNIEIMNKTNTNMEQLNQHTTTNSIVIPSPITTLSSVLDSLFKEEEDVGRKEAYSKFAKEEKTMVGVPNWITLIDTGVTGSNEGNTTNSSNQVKPNITFQDIFGLGEEIEHLQHLAVWADSDTKFKDYFKSYNRPKGAVLVGDKGSGRRTCAYAFANQIGAAILNIECSAITSYLETQWIQKIFSIKSLQKYYTQYQQSNGLDIDTSNTNTTNNNNKKNVKGRGNSRKPLKKFVLYFNDLDKVLNSSRTNRIELALTSQLDKINIKDTSLWVMASVRSDFDYRSNLIFKGSRIEKSIEFRKKPSDNIDTISIIQQSMNRYSKQHPQELNCPSFSPRRLELLGSLMKTLDRTVIIQICKEVYSKSLSLNVMVTEDLFLSCLDEFKSPVLKIYQSICYKYKAEEDDEDYDDDDRVYRYKVKYTKQYPMYNN